MSTTMKKSLSSDALRSKAQQDGSEKRVEVNQRMLIDKMLARYSSDFVVCRELIQNSDDAHATSFHFEMTCETPTVASNVQESIVEPPVAEVSTGIDKFLRLFSGKKKARSEDESATSPNASTPSSDSAVNFHNSTITEIRTVNNGLIFDQTDWTRVAAIAEGNTNVDSVGQFGVGFFSVFSFSEEPIITSGNDYMAFVWRDENSLTTFRHQLPVEEQSKTTSVILKIRTKYVLHTVDKDPTTIAENPNDESNVKSVKKTKKNIPLNEIVPTIHLTQLKAYFTKVLSFTKYINELVIKINNITVFEVTKRKTIVPPIQGTLLFKPHPSMNNMLRFDSYGHTEQTFTIANGPSITLSHIGVDARVTIDEQYHNHIRRIMKKSLPATIQIQLLFAQNNILANQSSSADSDLHTKILNSLIPLKFDNDTIIPSGFVFIGLGTHQTTGIGMHVYSHFIPTIERENLDLQDPYIAKWNRELLASTGQIARLIYDKAMLTNSNGSQGSVDNYQTIIGPFSFQPSTPNDEVGQTIVDGFFASNKEILVPVRRVPSDPHLSVISSGQAFLANSKHIHAFLSLPLVPFELTESGLITTLAIRGLIDYADKSMIEKILATSVLSIGEFLQLFYWLFSSDVADDVYAKRILSIVHFLDHPTSVVIPFRSIKYYDSLNIPLLIPLPSNIFPRHISAQLSQEQLEKQLSLSALTLQGVISVYFHDSQLYLLRDSRTSPCLLSLISRHSGQLTQAEWIKIKQLLANIECIPTTQGMKLPHDSFVPSAMLSPQLPAIVLNIPQNPPDSNNKEDKQVIDTLDNPVSIHFLKLIGCRMFNLNAFDDDQSVSSNSQSIQIFIQQLMKERNNMSEADFNALKQKESLRGQWIQTEFEPICNLKSASK